jgi:endo-1,4-beta-xylanase
MKCTLLLVLLSFPLALSCASGPSNTPTSSPSLSPTGVPTLRSLAQARDIEVGAAVAADPLRDEPLYADTLAREFSMLTPENAVKFEPVHPEPDRYDFSDADFIVDFAEAHGMRVRGHTLVWHNQLPGWLTEGTWTRDELIDVLREHIMTVVGHYRGRVAAWDVVNEAVADDGSLRDTIWLRGIGPDYIDMAFHWAHEADPDALLFYNDYAAEGLGPKSDAVYALVQGLLERGAPINGVGLQMHVSLGSPPDPEAVAANMARLGALGLQVHVTEMDVRTQDGTGTPDERLAAQAGVYRAVMDVCLSSGDCKAFVTWGFSDRHSWIPGHTGNPDAPLLFDESYRPKPAYYAIMDALARR